ncbi:MAG: ornithine carbamoyltransferase [Anaerolineales bacterium]
MRHYLAVDQLSHAELHDLLALAKQLKQELRNGGNKPVLKGRVLAMVFQKPSLRTRVSFDVGTRQLGGDAIYLSPQEIGLGQRESVADVARVLSGYAQGIMARVFDHAHVEELARYATVPVINGLSDYNHPCQALADIFTIYERRDQLEGLTLAYFGDGNNVATSLLYACAILGINFRIAAPPGYELDMAVSARGRELAQASGSAVLETHDPAVAAADADILYTDVWTSMGQEANATARLNVFPPYQINSDLLSRAKPDALVMHCLPAHRGEEITDEVVDGPNSVVFQQAENRMHAQKALLVRLLANPS